MWVVEIDTIEGFQLKGIKLKLNKKKISLRIIYPKSLTSEINTSNKKWIASSTEHKILIYKKHLLNFNT